MSFTDCITDLADDFKPLSVDHSKPGNLRVGEGDEVNMSLPVVQVCVCTCMDTHTHWSVCYIVTYMTLCICGTMLARVSR